MRLPKVAKALVSSIFNIPRRSLYSQGRNKVEVKSELLRQQILSCLELNPAYGHRRIAIALSVGKKRVRRVMRLNGIKPYKRKARWRKRRDMRRPPAPYGNLIKGTCPIHPATILVGDFTHIVHLSKVFYLATFMDLYTREIVGWHVSSKHTKELALEAILDAIKTIGKLPDIVHTDQGSEYTSREYVNFLESLGISISMSKKASPWENGYQESFYNNFKTDLGLEFDRFLSLGELVEAIHGTIHYYNTDRIHTVLKMSPEKFKTLNSVV